MIAQIVLAAVYVMSMLIFARAIMSWFNPDPRNPIVEFLVSVTEPILAPLRRVLPRMGMIDLTPMIALLILMAIGRVVAAGA